MIKMADILKPTTIGNVVLDHFTINEKPDIWAMMDGIPPGTYARLKINGETAMSDTPMEHRTNRSFINGAFGDVLIGGLGIGMVLMAIQDKEEITTITVVEKSHEVINIIASQLPLNEKVTIICDDVYTYKPSARYDVIYLDIWNWINDDIYQEEMKPLKAKYRRYLKPKKENPRRCVSCWAEFHAKTNRKLY